MKKGVGALGLEMVSIVVAIVLGFAVTNWGETRSERERAATAVERIRMELAANSASIAESVPYYRAVAGTLDSIARVDGDVDLFVTPVPGWRGVSPPRLRTASFVVATSTGVLSSIDFETADALAMAYGGMEDLSVAVDQAFAATMGGSVRTVTEWTLVMSLLGEVSASAQARVDEALRAIPAGSS